MFKKIAIVTCSSFLLANQVNAVIVPGSVPPVQMTTSALYADDTRGIAVPEHDQIRMQTSGELLAQANQHSDDLTFSDSQGNNISPKASPKGVSKQDASVIDQLEKIANDPGYLSPTPDVNVVGQRVSDDVYQNAYAQQGQMQGGFSQNPMVMQQQQQQYAQQPYQVANQPANTGSFNQVNTGFRTVPTQTGSFQGSTMADDGGVEIVTGRVETKALDMKNSVVKLREDRVSIKRVVRRMLDQIGGGAWSVVWSLSEENSNLPDMEISIYTEEPFMNVLNALLARLQTRSGQSLRVVKYNNSQRLVITDQQGALQRNFKSAGVNVKGKVAVTEQVLNEAKVVLHYDEIPLVDALENMVNQASGGQWRLRVYAGMDQVLKPAHIEEPFNIAMERILTLFNLKFEIFPGGKLVVVTSSSSAGYTNMQQ